MANSADRYYEVDFGSLRARVYDISLANGDTDIAITPGVEFGAPVGGYLRYAESAGTYTITVTDAGGTAYTNIIFFQTQAKTL